MSRGGKYQPQNRFRQSNKGARNDHIRSFVPIKLVRLGCFSHACMEQAICKVLIEQVPYFNAFIYAANHQAIGKVDDVFGKIHGFSISISLNDPKLLKTFNQGDEFFIDQHKLLPLVRFLSKSNAKKNMAAKRKPKQAKNQLKNPGGSVVKTIGRGRRAYAEGYRRSVGGRNLQYKRQRMCSNNNK